MGDPQAALAERPELACPARIERLRRRYLNERAYLSVERARLYTESWRASEGAGLPAAVRVAKAMQRVYAAMTHYVDPDDRIAGYWTERFLGVPIDIERGVFNAVLEAELTRASMARFRARSFARGFGYMVRKGVLREFVRNQRIARASGAAPLDMGLTPMHRRAINPFHVEPEDRRLLAGELLPYWKGRTTVDRVEEALLEADLYSRDMHDFVMAVPGNTSRQVLMLSTSATIASLQGHVILDFERPLRVGLRALEALARERLHELRAQGADAGQLATMEAMALGIAGVRTFARRLAERLAVASGAETDPARRVELAEMARICGRVPEEPATTFREAVQALWTVKTAVELAHPINLHCFGRLDQLLGPYYEQDLAAGHTSAPEARELLAELLLKIQSQNMRPESNLLSRFYHRFLGSSPVTVGGLTPAGEDGTNALTFLFLEAAHVAKAVTNVSIRAHRGTPDSLLERVAELLSQGTSSFSLYSDEMTIRAMERRGFATEDARDYAIMGCVEATCPGRTGSMSANALLLSRLLDITLRNGDSKTLVGPVRGVGLRTGEADGFATFEELLGALLAQARHSIAKIAQGSDLRDRIYAEHQPAPLISAFMGGCLESARDVTAGGACYDLSGISMINSIANLVDSLHVIRRLVFEQRAFTLGELVEAIDRNFQGCDRLLRAIRGVEGRWGNGDAEVDALARRVAGELFRETYRHRSFKGAPFVPYVISMTTHTIDGRLSIATPDGRRAATPYAASCNPFNVERSGVTAALRSVAALPFEDVLGAAVNVKFHPSAVGLTPAARAKWVALVRAYFGLGGAQMQPTVASAEVLREAQLRPGEHQDLIVKVGGYSAYFTDLGREIQDEVIARTEHR